MAWAAVTQRRSLLVEFHPHAALQHWGPQPHITLVSAPPVSHACPWQPFSSAAIMFKVQGRRDPTRQQHKTRICDVLTHTVLDLCLNARIIGDREARIQGPPNSH